MSNELKYSRHTNQCLPIYWIVSTVDVLFKENCSLLFVSTMVSKTGPEVIKLFSSSTQLSMNIFMLINLKLLTMPNSFFLNIAEHEYFSANIYENAFSYLLAEKISCSAELSMKKVLV